MTANREKKTHEFWIYDMFYTRNWNWNRNNEPKVSRMKYHRTYVIHIRFCSNEAILDFIAKKLMNMKYCCDWNLIWFYIPYVSGYGIWMHHMKRFNFNIHQLIIESRKTLPNCFRFELKPRSTVPWARTLIWCFTNLTEKSDLDILIPLMKSI